MLLLTLDLGYQVAQGIDKQAKGANKTMAKAVEQVVYNALTKAIFKKPVTDQKFSSILEKTSIGPALLKMKDDENNTLLHYAAEWGDLIKTRKSIIKMAPELRNEKNKDGETPFDVAESLGTENIPDNLKPEMTDEDMQQEIERRKNVYKKEEEKRIREKKEQKDELLKDIRDKEKKDRMNAIKKLEEELEEKRKELIENEAIEEIEKRLADLRKKNKELDKELAEDVTPLTTSIKSLKPKLFALSAVLQKLQ